MRYFKKPNAFTLLVVAAGFAAVFRLVDIAAAVEDSREQPPVLTKEDIAKGVQDTAKAADAGATEAAPKEAPKDAPKDAPRDASKETPKSPVVNGPADAAPQSSFSTSEIGVLQALAQRRDELDQREKTLSQREALLKAAEQEVDSKIAELNKLKGAMENLLGQQQKAEDDRIGSLVKIYENMKPSEAARIFDSLDMDILLDVIGRMNERKASPVLAAMNPEKAKDLTIRLAEQKKLPVGKAAAPKSPAPAPDMPQQP